MAVLLVQNWTVALHHSGLHLLHLTNSLFYLYSQFLLRSSSNINASCTYLVA